MALDLAVGGALDPERLVAPATAARSGFIAEAEHSDGISSFVLEWQQPVEWAAFTRAIEALIALRGPDLLRVKGILIKCSALGVPLRSRVSSTMRALHSAWHA